MGVSAQALGIAQAAYEEALKYAKEREQFGKAIYNIPAVTNMLLDMRVSLESCRSLFYSAAQSVDIKEKLDEKIQKLFDAVPSPNSGLLFCTGTRYESGINIIQQIEQLGSKIFHVHFRNVKGTISENGGYEEVMLDDGDMNMLEVLRALSNAGYAGALNPDHFPILSGDTNTRNAGRAFAVGYIRALLSAL